MDLEKLTKAAHPDNLGAYIAGLPEMMHDMGTGVIDTVREEEYKGHKIVIHTTYRIEVDGKPYHGHLILDNAGRLQCHGLPNYSFGSAIKMVEQLIDTFPEEFSDTQTDPSSEHGAGGHMPGMPGM